MGREVRRVPLDFDWPIDKVWDGYLLPQRLRGKTCPDCEGGTTHFGHWMSNFTYVISMLATDVQEAERGRPMHPWLAEFSRHHGHFEYRVGGRWVRIEDVPEDIRHRGLFGYESQFKIDRPGPKDQTLQFFQGLIRKSYAIKRARGSDEYDYDKLYADDTVPPVDQVGSSIGYCSSGSGGGNIQAALIQVLLDAAGFDADADVDFACQTCDGQGVLEEFPGQRAERDAWNEVDHNEESGPPTGEGYQLWETVSEGSPISPVFATPEELATWMSSSAYTKWSLGSLPDYDTALRFVNAGWAPSGIFTPERGFEDGVTAIGREKD